MPSSPKHARRANLVIGAVLVGLLLLIAVVNLVYTPYSPLDVNIHARYAPPSLHHWFGTDEFGRDILSRIMSGAGVSTTVSVCSVLFALLAGTSIGAVCGYAGGWFDRLAARTWHHDRGRAVEMGRGGRARPGLYAVSQPHCARRGTVAAPA